MILLGLLFVLTAGVLQVFGSSHVATERLAQEHRREVAAIHGLRQGQPLGTLEHAAITGAVEVGPALVGLGTVGLGYEAVLNGRFLAGGTSDRVLVLLPEEVLDGWQEGRQGDRELQPSGVGTLSVVPGEPFEVSWRQSAVEDLQLRLGDGVPVHVELELSQGRPTGAWSPRQDRWRLEATGPVELNVDLDSTRYAWARDLGLLGALGMVLFGVGFLYLNEGERPGSLDDVRLGGAVLLALDYAVFFAVASFLLIGTQLPPRLSLGLAFGVGAPLLGWHLTHLTDLRFALRRGLPWGLGTWGLAALWIAAPWLRTLALLFVAVGALAFVTLTYGPYRRRKERAEQARCEGVLQQARDQRVATGRRSLCRVLALQPGRVDQALETVRMLPSGLAAERGRVFRALDHLELWVERATALLAIEGPVASEEEVEAWLESLSRSQARVMDAATEIDAALQALEDRVVEVQEELQRALYASARLVDAQRAVGEGSPSEDELRVLLERVESGEHDLNRLADEAWELVRRGERAVLRPEGAVHCLACGAPHPEGSRYCTGCGRERPPQVTCGGCGASTLLPSHLLPTGWMEQRLHCGCCGEELPLSPAAPRWSTGCRSAFRSSSSR